MDPSPPVNTALEPTAINHANYRSFRNTTLRRRPKGQQQLEVLGAAARTPTGNSAMNFPRFATHSRMASAVHRLESLNLSGRFRGLSQSAPKSEVPGVVIHNVTET